MNMKLRIYLEAATDSCSAKKVFLNLQSNILKNTYEVVHF